MTTHKRLLLLAAAWICAAAAPAKPSHPSPPHAAGKAPAQSQSQTQSQTQSQAPADARDPAGVIALLSTLNAKGEVARHEGDSVFVTVTSATEIFSIQFAGCNPQGRGCQAMLFDRLGQGGSPSPAQVNAFNQTSVMCRVYQDRSGKPHVEYSTLLFGNTGRAELLMHINAWRGCIGDFSEFLKDPNGYLAQAA